MSAADLRDRLREAEDEGRPWALLVEHVDGRVEAHTSPGVAMVVTVLDETRSALADWLLVDDLVPCDVARMAIGYSLGECPRCRRGAPTSG